MMSVKILLITISILATSLSETIHINDSARLKEYLCPSSGTLPPNTNLMIESSLNVPVNEDQFCFIANTTNISIVATSPELNVTVTCMNDNGFGFLNVSHLTIRSVYFKRCHNIIPEMAVNNIEEADQFYDARTSLIFNHCYSVTLYNVVVDNSPNITYGITGINLCGQSNISAVMHGNYPKSTMLIYYTDSIVNATCSGNLYITSNMFSATVPEIHNMSIPDFILKGHSLSIFMVQQQFAINVNITIEPIFQYPGLIYKDINIQMCFINSHTSSLVTFQGYPHEMCMNKEDPLLASIFLNVYFYETPSFNTTVSHVMYPLLIHNTAFMSDWSYLILRFHQLGIYKLTHKLSHLVKIDNITSCGYGSPYLVYAIDYNMKYGKSLYLEMNNVSMNHTDSINSMRVNNVEINFTGNTYILRTSATMLEVYSSNLIMSGNVSISGTYHPSCFNTYDLISLDERSTLFLKEPLNITFSNLDIL